MLSLALFALSRSASAATDPTSDDDAAARNQARITCTSSGGARPHCPADTSSGVALVKSSGSAPCLLGKAWGYDDTGIWVSDGRAGEFVAGRVEQEQKRDKGLEYVPNLGFRPYEREKGQVYFRLFSIAPITDDGYQLQSSAMAIQKALQLYLSGSQIFGSYGDASELRAEVNWYFVKERGLRVDVEWIHLDHCPVGYTAVPYPVGGDGNLVHINLELNF